MKIVRDSVMENYRRNFYHVYHTHIFPIFDMYEPERIKKLSLVVLVAVITAILAFGVFLCSITQENDDIGEILMCVAIGIGVLGGWIIYSIRDNFISNLKKSCMGHIVQVFGNLSWTPHIDLIDDYEARNSELFAPYNRRTSDDSFSGEYKGINFKICETHMWREQGSGKNRRTIEVFKGVLVKFDFNKSINSKTVIMTKSRDGGKIFTSVYILFLVVSLGGNLLLAFLAGLKSFLFIGGGLVIFLIVYALISRSKNRKGSYLQELKLEDPEFNKHYRAYSTNQVEGRYLITPAFMERFKHIQTAFGAKNAKCAFYDSHILFALSTNKNLFEVGGLFHTLKDPKQMEEFFNELTSIMRLIDRFKLTEHTGL